MCCTDEYTNNTMGCMNLFAASAKTALRLRFSKECGCLPIFMALLFFFFFSLWKWGHGFQKELGQNMQLLILAIQYLDNIDLLTGFQKIHQFFLLPLLAALAGVTAGTAAW